MDKSKVFRKWASPRRMWRMCVAALATVAATQVAAQDSACDFFKGKTVELSVPFEAGGGFDIYARMVAKFMAGELGAAHMIVRNEPGAGGLLGTNQTWEAEPDGLRIQLAFTGGMITAELGGAAGVGFRSNEFSWIGRITGEPDVIVKAPESALRDADDLKELSAERKIRIGSTGVGAGNYIEARLIAEISTSMPTSSPVSAARRKSTPRWRATNLTSLRLRLAAFRSRKRPTPRTICSFSATRALRTCPRSNHYRKWWMRNICRW